MVLKIVEFLPRAEIMQETEWNSRDRAEKRKSKVWRENARGISNSANDG